jgi:hypothetical protein
LASTFCFSAPIIPCSISPTFFFLLMLICRQFTLQYIIQMSNFPRKLFVTQPPVVQSRQMVFQYRLHISHGIVRRTAARSLYKFTSTAFLPSSFTFNSWHTPMNI